MNKLKLRHPFLSLALAASIVTVSLTSCTTPQQTVTYNSLFSIEALGSAAYSGYVGSILAGTTTTNNLPAVSKAFDDFQAGVALASALDQASTNALAPANLMLEFNALTNLISVAKGK